MTTYDLYLESGPRRRKTMVHVPALLGCTASGPTTEEALAATPEAITTFLRFLQAHGESVDPDAPFTTRVAEHAAEAGAWLGNGSPYVTFAPDLEPLTEDEIERLLARFVAIREMLAGWADGLSAADLAIAPAEGGRANRAVLLHVMDVGGYLSVALGGASGFSRLCGAAERGELPLAEGLRGVTALAVERVRATTPAERAAVIQRPKELRTLRKALRRMLEHGWEHLAELARRPEGPALR